MDNHSIMVASLTGCLSAAMYYSWVKVMKPNLKTFYLDLQQTSWFIKGIISGMAKSGSPFDFCAIFEKRVKLYKDKTLLIFEGREYTYGHVDEMSNRVANLMISKGLQNKDVVALFLTNSPQFIWIFIGLLKIGVIPSLLNYNIQGKGLVHSTMICEPKLFIVDSDRSTQHNLQQVYKELGDIPIFITQTRETDIPPFEPTWLDLNSMLNEASSAPISPTARDPIEQTAIACYIYTSGTTGLPKACNFYSKKFVAAAIFCSLFNIANNDTIYVVLPLYHTAGLCFGFVLSVVSGSTMVLRRKFSASKFWDDITTYKVTAMPYIGELCRYIFAQPDKSNQTSHNLRFIYGNGLGRDIWEQFQTKFKIPHIYEFYGSSEGNCFFINMHNKYGAIGRHSPFLNIFNPNKMVIVKYDLDTEQPLRNAKGRCIPVETGEAGLLIGKCIPMNDLQMYKGKKDLDSAKKLHNVFTDGDKYFNSGDLIYSDADNFVYFKDRIGDTFRWKGENVSTLDVANVLRDLNFIQDANVYGVKVPGQDGRAGMASLKLYHANDLTDSQTMEIYNHCQENIASYAIPLFLRVQEEMDITGTFKLQKSKLQKEGFDPNIITDALYFIDHNVKTYLPLSNEVFMRYNLVQSKL